MPTRDSAVTRIIDLIAWVARRPEAVTVAEAVRVALRLIDEATLAEPSMRRYTGLWIAFSRFCAQTQVDNLAEVTPALVDQWLTTLTRKGRPPSPSTRRNRRSALRKLFELLRFLGVTAVDPTIDLALPSRAPTECRALADGEIAWCRSASLKTTVETRQPAIWALAESGAATSEIPQVRPEDLNLQGGRVWLRGHTKTDARWAELSPWGVVQLGRRLDGRGAHSCVTYAGNRSVATAQAATANALREILIRSGIGGRPGVCIKSVRLTYGLSILARTGRIEDAATALGMRSLDQTVELLGVDWRSAAP